MNTTKSILKLAISIALAFTFGCSSGGSGGNDDPDGGGNGQGGSLNVNPQIYNEDGSLFTENGVIKFASSYNDDVLINAGSVTDGIVKLNLPQTVPDEYLLDFDKLLERMGCNSSQKNVKLIEAKFLLYSNGEQIGRLDAYYEDKEILEESTGYLYFSKDIKAICNYKDGDDNRKLDINAKRGWSKVYMVRKCTSYNSENDRCDIWNIESSTSNILKKEKELKWILEQY